VVPVLVYDEVGSAADWLCATFGLAERFRRVDDDGVVVTAQLVIGDGAVMLTPSRVGQGFASPDEALLREPRPGEVCHKLSVRVTNIDEHHGQTLAAGGTVLNAPTTYPFGERQYTAEDLAGHRWTFTESVDDVAPDRWGAQMGPGYR
jgi:uncharacterized glyoxalase superfamily protein PhnB